MNKHRKLTLVSARADGNATAACQLCRESPCKVAMLIAQLKEAMAVAEAARFTLAAANIAMAIDAIPRQCC